MTPQTGLAIHGDGETDLARVPVRAFSQAIPVATLHANANVGKAKLVHQHMPMKMRKCMTADAPAVYTGGQNAYNSLFAEIKG